MMKLFTLVTSMHQTDMSLYTTMNIQTDAIIANQTDNDILSISKINGKQVQLISTSTRGLSRNRNIGLCHIPQDCDIVLFSDDDLVFNDGYEKMILSEFVKHPKADAIKFNIHDLSKTRKISMARITKFEKATRRNMSSSGVCGLAIKLSVLRVYNLFFYENFGAGTDNYCGEDTIFLQNLINKGVHLYRSPVDIAGIDQTESSWFKGYDEKYFTVTGKVFATIYPRLCHLLALRSSFRFARRKKCNMGFFKILSCYRKGIKEIKHEK